MIVVPSMVQIAGKPLSFCQRMSDLPSPLKSAAAATCHVGPAIGKDGAASERGAVHGPDRRQAAVVLPKNVGLAVAVEIGRRSDMPRGPNIGKDGAASDRGAVHGPDRRQAAVVLPKNVGLAVAVEIGRSSDMPRGPTDRAGRRRQ